MHASRSIATLALLLATAAFAGEAKAKAVALPAKDVARLFMVDQEPVNADGTCNVLVQPRTGKDRKAPKGPVTALVPRSILAREKGGNGEPVPAVLLGVQPAPGTLVRGRAIALVTRTVAGKAEIRVVVAAYDSRLGSCRSMEEVEALAPGALAQVKEAFGPARDPAFAVQGRREAQRFLGDAITDFMCAYVTDADRRPLDPDGNPQLYRWSGARNIGE